MVLDITASTFSTTLASGYALGTSNSTGLSGFINTLMTTNCGFTYTAGSFSTSNILVYSWTASGAAKGSFYIEITISVSGSTFTIAPRLIQQANYNTGTFTATTNTAATGNSFTVSNTQTLVGYSLPIATTDVKGFVLYQGSFSYCGACLVVYPGANKPSFYNEANYCYAGIWNNNNIGRFNIPFPNQVATIGATAPYASYNPDTGTFSYVNNVDGNVDIISSPVLFLNNTANANTYVYGKLASDIGYGNSYNFLIGDPVTKTAGVEVWIIIVPATIAFPGLLLRTT